MSEQNGATLTIVITLVLLILAITSCQVLGAEPNVPFEYDPNLCAPIMDWAYAEPNIPVIYTVSLYFPVADPNVIDVNEMTMTVAEPNDANDLDFLSQYHGVSPVIPVGYIHSWTVSFTPTVETVYYIHLIADYSYDLASHTQAWSTRTIVGHDERTILLNCTPHRPYLQPGPSPEALAMAQRHVQYAKKHGKKIGYAQVLGSR
ncbi:MAG TPA: hypothetical protein HPP87_10015 [Planctomycetes bacterium]|nr:hypothetical protein [Planctomycetota bacterium]